MIKAVIFDMDGVITNTEPLQYKSYAKTLERYGVKLTEEEYILIWVRSGKGIADFIKKHNLDIIPSEAREVKRKIYHRLLNKELEVIKNAPEVIRELLPKYKLAMVSAAHNYDVDLVMKLTGLKECFSVIVSGTDVKETKPSPEGYLLAAKKLRVKPEQCLVVEDAEKGIIAAHRAGMKSVAVPNSYTKEHDFSKADKTINNISELVGVIEDIC